MNGDKTAGDVLAALERCRIHIELIADHLKHLSAAAERIAETLQAPTHRFVVGHHVRFIDPGVDCLEWVITKIDADWVYISLPTDPAYQYFAKPDELRIVEPLDSPPRLGIRSPRLDSPRGCREPTIRAPGTTPEDQRSPRSL